MRKRLKIALRLLASVLACCCLIGTGPDFPVQAQAQAPATVTPVPRSGSWMQMHEKFLAEAKKGNIDLLFLGDSITQGWGNNVVWKRFYGPRHAANFGIGGDRTEHVLWRLQHGEVDGIHPRVVVLMIGTNNCHANTSVEIFSGIKAIVEELRKRLPDSKILLLGVFPRGQKPNGLREKLDDVNEQISRLDDGKSVVYLNIGKAFLNADDTISPDVMPDYLHLTGKGYRLWADAMEPTLWKLLNEPAGDRGTEPPPTQK
jgi:lysophospholipase L1-like esterase